MKLLVSYYRSENKARREEYTTCLKDNINNKLIDEIIVFLREPMSIPDLESNKITYVENPECTYRSFLEYCNKNLKGEICIVSNGDMMFDESLRVLEDEDLYNKFLCLTRWDTKEGGEIEYYSPPHGSEKTQDVWIFQAPVDIDMNEANICLAHQGCDSRMAMVAFKNGLKVCNPSLTIKCRHLHLTKHRTTAGDRSKRIMGDYLFVYPSKDFNPPDFYEYAEPELNNNGGLVLKIKKIKNEN